jgi:hypothetical protein
MRLYSAHQPAQRPGHNGDRGDWKVIGPRSLNPTALAVGNNVLIESRGGQPLVPPSALQRPPKR